MTVDVAAFESAMPDDVRAVISEARSGGGVAGEWINGDRARCWLVLANRRDIASPVIGWLLGISLFDDDGHAITRALGRPSFRDDALPHALAAVAAAIRIGLPIPPRVWVSADTMHRRVREPVPELLAVLAHGLIDTSAVTRSAALHIAARIGEPARAQLRDAAAHATGVAATRLAAALTNLTASSPSGSSSDDDLLAEVIAIWREHRDAASELAVVQLGGRVGRARGPLTTLSRGELEVAWRARAGARNPLDLSLLLDSGWPRSRKDVMRRVAMLGEFAPDPRIAIRLLQLAPRVVHPAIERVVARSMTPSVGALVDGAQGRGGAPIYGELAAQHWELATRGGELSSAARDTIEAARAIADPHDSHRLLAEHLADPVDLAARAVLADALQVAGDPRGELIAIQLAANARAEHRSDELLARFADQWTSPLPAAVRRAVRFARGFPVALTTNARHGALERLATRHEWSTLEEVHLWAADVDLAPLLRRMPLLHTLGAHPSSLIALARFGPFPRITTIVCSEVFQPPAGLFPDLRSVVTAGP